MRLLPGRRAARVAPGVRVDAAADLRVRGHARAAGGQGVSRRPHGAGVLAQRRGIRRQHNGVPGAAQERPATRHLVAGGRLGLSAFAAFVSGPKSLTFPLGIGLSNNRRHVDGMTTNLQYAAPQQRAGDPEMAIGEFGGAPASGGPIFSNGLYWAYEMTHAALNPARALASVTQLYFKNPLNPIAHTTYGKSMAAAMELFERSTRRYSKPAWDIDSTVVSGERAPIHISTIWQRPFCNLLHFERMFCHMPRRPQPKVLIVAPMSGHYATLLRGTVEAFIPNHDVYITDWVDARMVPLSEGCFDLDDYIDYIISILHRIGGDTHVIAVCQPSVPVMAATALMEADGDPYAP